MPRPLSIPDDDSSQVKQLRDAYERKERSSTPTPRCNCVCVGPDFDNCVMSFQNQNAKHAVQGQDHSGMGIVEFVAMSAQAPCFVGSGTAEGAADHSIFARFRVLQLSPSEF